MKKILAIAIALVMVLGICSIPAFAAEDYEVDLATIGGVANYAAHGYPDRQLCMFGYGTVISLGVIDLSAFDSVEITYATDMGYQAFKDGMKATAMWALKSDNVTIGYVDVGPNEDNLLGKGDLVDASVLNPDGTNWDKGERTTTIDLSNVDYNGEVFLSHFNSTGNEALLVGIKFIAKAAPSEPVTRSFNKDTDKQYFDQIQINGEGKADGNEAVAALKALIDGSDGSVKTIGMYGWFGQVNGEIATVLDKFGYIIDDGEPVFGDFATDTAQDVADLNGIRYLITVDVSGLKDGKSHKITACAKLANGDVVLFNRENREAIINYQAPRAAAQQTEENAKTGDMTVAMFAVIAVLAMGAAVVFMKKKVF